MGNINWSDSEYEVHTEITIENGIFKLPRPNFINTIYTKNGFLYSSKGIGDFCRIGIKEIIEPDHVYITYEVTFADIDMSGALTHWIKNTFEKTTVTKISICAREIGENDMEIFKKVGFSPSINDSSVLNIVKGSPKFTT